MRFAWLRKNSTAERAINEGCINLMRLGYNALWLAPILLSFNGIIDYSTGFLAFTLVIILRFSANLYVNNVLGLEQAESFPFRT